MNKVFLFDFDGTIADSMSTLVTIFNELVDIYHLPRKIMKSEVPSLRKFHVRQLIKEFGIPPLKIPLILWSARKKFSTHISSIKPVKGMYETIVGLKAKGITLGIVSSNNVENIMKFLKQNNLDVFDFIYSEQSLFGKDKVLQHVIKQYKLSSKNIYYVGDEIRDIEAAKKMGIKMIAVTWGANEKETLQKSLPNFLIVNPKKLLTIS